MLELERESVIIVRDNEGAINALVNVCRHRGSRVCLQSKGRSKRLACRYHGWVYDLDGALIAARQMDAAVAVVPDVAALHAVVGPVPNPDAVVARVGNAATGHQAVLPTLYLNGVAARGRQLEIAQDDMARALAGAANVTPVDHRTVHSYQYRQIQTSSPHPRRLHQPF